MRKISLISIAMLIVSIPTFAGGLLTNTNQHPAFLRMLSRGANTTSRGLLPCPTLRVWPSCRKTGFIHP